MMVLHHSIGPGCERSSFAWSADGFRWENLTKRFYTAWHPMCIDARLSYPGIGTVHSNCSLSTSELQSMGSAQAYENLLTRNAGISVMHVLRVVARGGWLSNSKGSAFGYIRFVNFINAKLGLIAKTY